MDGGRSDGTSRYSIYRTFLAADIESYGGLERSDSVRVRLRRHLKDWCRTVRPGRRRPRELGAAGHRRRLAPLDRPERLPSLLSTCARHRERLLAYNKDSPHAERLRCAWPCTCRRRASDPDPFVGRRPSMSAGHWTARYCAHCLRATTQPLAVLVLVDSTRAWHGAHGGLDPAAGSGGRTGRRGRRTPGFTCRGTWTLPAASGPLAPPQRRTLAWPRSSLPTPSASLVGSGCQ